MQPESESEFPVPVRARGRRMGRTAWYMEKRWSSGDGLRGGFISAALCGKMTPG